MTPPLAALVVVSGELSPELRHQIAAGLRPRADFYEIASTAGADILDYRRAAELSPWLIRTLARVAGNDLGLAWTCFRRRSRYGAIFTDSERVGMLYASFCLLIRRRPRHVMIGHRLSATKKRFVHRLLHLRRRIDHVIVYADAQRRLAIERLGYREAQVTLMPFMVDPQFWRTGEVARRRQRPLICAVGQELRDYATFAEAVRNLDVDVVIAGWSPWSKRANTALDVDLPSNVEVSRLDPYALRQLYDEADLVVVPIQETDFQAGITTILEAMSMGRAVVCTRTMGQTDTVIEGVTGRYVPPGDEKAMRSVICELLTDPGRATRLGQAGRTWVRDNADIELYAREIAAIVCGSDS